MSGSKMCVSIEVQPFISSCTMGKLVMLVVIFVSVISLAVSRSSNFKKLSEKNLKRQYSHCNYDQYVCSDDFMTCASHCNGIKECNNGEDEMYCGCSDPDQWHCDDGIECATTCDGSATCPNGEDEKWCGCSDPSQGHCDDGATCGTYCDGSADCPGGEDEQWCGCSDPMQMQCMDGTCATFCDGNPECADDDDEMWCDMNMSGCADPMQTYCNDGASCAYWCDGSWECSDGEDEMWCGDMNYASSTHNPLTSACVGMDFVASHDFCQDYYYAYGYMKKNSLLDQWKKGNKGTLGNLKYLLTARRNEALKQRILKKLGGSK
ncbi:unnamed protein product [Mytilus edulis]|uniref:Uncharacterized protein n=1 Tax=Mytilus edulis TaxID=6550 RepID=A0A8S3SD28_MYTED|nr:unnamed protein product [Mytilus edulis]